MKKRDCRIAEMLARQKKHVSFHTPGHKRAGTDITELSYSDDLSSPRGVIKTAEEEIARILGAERSFILTDGSTSGVYAMLAALRAAGCKRIAVPTFSHISVQNGCRSESGTRRACSAVGSGTRARGLGGGRASAHVARLLRKFSAACRGAGDLSNGGQAACDRRRARRTFAFHFPACGKIRRSVGGRRA